MILFYKFKQYRKVPKRERQLTLNYAAKEEPQFSMRIYRERWMDGWMGGWVGENHFIPWNTVWLIVDTQ